MRVCGAFLSLRLALSLGCPKPWVSLGAVSEPASTDTPERVQTLLQDFGDCFPADFPDGLPPDRGMSHTIELEPGSKPVHRAMYRPSPSERTEVYNTVTAELLQLGMIQPSTSIPVSCIICSWSRRMAFCARLLTIVH